ncbi:MAG: TonB-dependent receptor plug domain-containing protein [Burkholderiaceae bacterium]
MPKNLRPRPPFALSVIAGLLFAAPTFAQTPAPAPAPPPAEAPAPASAPPAQTPPAKPDAEPARVLPGVEVRGQRNATEDRRNSSAAKIVIDRETIEQYGDSNLGEVLRRMPGVTTGGRPGRGGDIRMRGMGGGFTQILIDGERIPPGFSVDQITPEQVERIEIIRAPTAETGTRAIAGTINIILREPLRKLNDEIRAGVTEERGRYSPNLNWNHNGLLGPTGTYTFNASYNRTDQLTDTRTHTTYTDLLSGATTLLQDGLSQQHDVRNNLFASARMQWRLGQGESFSLQPFIVSNRNRSESTGTLNQTISIAQPLPYATRGSESETDFTLGRMNAQWMTRLSEKARLELRAGGGRFALDQQSATQQFDTAGARTLVQTTVADVTDTRWNTSGKLTYDLDGVHTITAGAELEGSRRKENTNTLINGVQSLADFSDLNVTTRRSAVYVQDEWDPVPNWSANVGLRWEALETRSDVLGQPVRNKSSVVSPLAHAVWRFNPASLDQLRLSLTQSYRAPDTQQLVARPILNTQFPAPGGNTATSPDRAGNAVLKPETAHGIDLAFERYLKSGGIIAVNVFARQINDLIRNVTTLETVPWATVPRWVSRPQNLGDALTKGVEFDAKFQLSELMDDVPPVNLRFNLSLYDSNVESVPGPNNRIDQQPRATGNFGADYRFKGTPFTLGGNISYTPQYPTQLTELQSQSVGAKRVLEAFLLWTANPNTRVRFTLANIAPRDSESSSTIIDGNTRQTTDSFGRTDMSASVRLEMKL